MAGSLYVHTKWDSTRWEWGKHSLYTSYIVVGLFDEVIIH